MDIGDWFKVEFDADRIRLNVSPPDRQPWSQEIRWADIERICFKAEDFTTADGIYVFTRQRSESYAIPIEAQGGSELWNAIIERDLFDAELAITAAAATGDVYCWPS